ncbi:MAG: hypoxanthine phosphoribosyltransferase [Verrucomicrobiota bacterium]
MPTVSEIALEILLDQASIQRRVGELGVKISEDFADADLCVMPVMDGGMIFAADLVREIHLPLTIKPIKASSYGEATTSSGIISLPWGIPEGIAGKDLLLVDDILDTGLTLNVLKEQLMEKGARSVRSCVLLRKESSVLRAADYMGFEIPDKFVVGYGLDYAGLYRNLPDIGVVSRTTG